LELLSRFTQKSANLLNGGLYFLLAGLSFIFKINSVLGSKKRDLQQKIDPVGIALTPAALQQGKDSRRVRKILVAAKYSPQKRKLIEVVFPQIVICNFEKESISPDFFEQFEFLC